MSEHKYTESRICSALVHRTFKGALALVNNCCAMGSECDLLVVTKNLMCIDVEIKISKADLKRDAGKDKWFKAPSDWRLPREKWEPLEWPRGIWKHYYCIAAPIWSDDLLQYCQPKSGVIVIKLGGLYGASLEVKRRCTARKDAKPLSPAQAINIARLASLRMWDAYAARDSAAAELQRQLAVNTQTVIS